MNNKSNKKFKKESKTLISEKIWQMKKKFNDFPHSLYPLSYSVLPITLLSILTNFHASLKIGEGKWVYNNFFGLYSIIKFNIHTE